MVACLDTLDALLIGTAFGVRQRSLATDNDNIFWETSLVKIAIRNPYSIRLQSRL